MVYGMSGILDSGGREALVVVRRRVLGIDGGLDGLIRYSLRSLDLLG